MEFAVILYNSSNYRHLKMDLTISCKNEVMGLVPVFEAYSLSELYIAQIYVLYFKWLFHINLWCQSFPARLHCFLLKENNLLIQDFRKSWISFKSLPERRPRARLMSQPFINSWRETRKFFPFEMENWFDSMIVLKSLK